MHVWLFGGLARLAPARPLVVEARQGCSVAEIITALDHQLGAGLLDCIMETPTRKLGICRLFLDGLSVELDERLPLGAAAADLELIVLTASEGG